MANPRIDVRKMSQLLASMFRAQSAWSRLHHFPVGNAARYYEVVAWAHGPRTTQPEESAMCANTSDLATHLEPAALIFNYGAGTTCCLLSVSEHRAHFPQRLALA